MKNKKVKTTKTKVHYNLDPLDSLGCDINIAWGERSNGKSYQVKHKKGVEKYVKTGRRFMLIRRKKEEIRSFLVDSYFSDVDVEKLTDGTYNMIGLHNSRICFGKFDFDTMKTKFGEHCGYAVALGLEQNYAGGSFLDVDDMVFEEFISRDSYYFHEPDKLMNLYSTVDRKQRRVRIWMVGNSISRACPYFSDWGLFNVVSHMKQGEIKSVEINTGTKDKDGEDIIMRVGLEYCQQTGDSSYAIGRHKNMLNSGSWQSDPQPHLPKSYNHYRMAFRIGFDFQEFRYIGELLLDPETNDYIWFVYPYLKEFGPGVIIVSDKVRASRFWIGDIYNANFPNRKVNEILQTFVESRVFFATDLCGTEFKNVANFKMKK